MSRQRRAGEASKPWAFRVTAAERDLWQAAADAIGAASLSDAVRPVITQWALEVLKRPPSKALEALEPVQSLITRWALEALKRAPGKTEQPMSAPREGMPPGLSGSPVLPVLPVSAPQVPEAQRPIKLSHGRKRHQRVRQIKEKT